MEAVKQQAYDIVISDYKLPGMDGLEFTGTGKFVRYCPT
jgi:CheY-like chemotaxis protein